MKLDTHRHGKDRHVRPLLLDDLRDGKCALNTLDVVRVTNHDCIRHVDRANSGGVADAGPAVDQGEVKSPHFLANGIEECAATEPFVERTPVEGIYNGCILRTLTACRDKVNFASLP